MILQRCRRAERAHNGRRVIREAAFGGIGGAEIKQTAAAGLVTLQSLRQTVGFKVPVRARGEHQMIYIRFAGYRITLLSLSISRAWPFSLRRHGEKREQYCLLATTETPPWIPVYRCQQVAGDAKYI